MNTDIIHIMLEEKEYPIRCTLFVLAAAQKKYGTLSECEYKLRGRKPVIENGEQKKDAKGRKLYEEVDPDAEAVLFILTLMLNEGMAIEAERENRSYVTLTEKWVRRHIDANIFEIKSVVLKEWDRSFAQTKKLIPNP